MQGFFRALRSRNFRLFFSGQAISLIGTWMQQTATSWLVYRISNSSVILGTTAFLSQIPNLIISPFAGVFLDRFSKHRILILTQSLLFLQAIILSILTLTHRIEIYQILLLSLFLGIVSSIDAPTRQSFVIEMVERKEDLGNAIALNSFLFNSARLIGPMISGILVALVGEGICFLINAITYIAVIFALILMKLKKREFEKSQNSILEDLKEGVYYSFNSIVVKNVLIFIFIASLISSSYSVLLPIFASEILKGGSETLGFLMSSTGCGALMGALYLAGRKNIKGIENIIVYALFFAGFGLILFSSSRNIFFSIFSLIIVGMSFMLNAVCSNTLVQTIIDDHIRGRVMSFYVTFFMGAMPIGSYIGGLISKLIGPSNTVLLGGIICIISALIYYSRLPILRDKIYSKIKIVSS
ncbi:MAG: MFS transporter [Dictyoglomus sp.]|nr:MFS transporter [Dictyoglomus sp.]MDW8188469.1 MFS transporter [Dictyoglomus sp.]